MQKYSYTKNNGAWPGFMGITLINYAHRGLPSSSAAFQLDVKVSAAWQKGVNCLQISLVRLSSQDVALHSWPKKKYI